MSTEAARNFSIKRGMLYFETSAKDGRGVKKMMTQIFKLALNIRVDKFDPEFSEKFKKLWRK